MKTFKELREQLNVKTHTPEDIAKKHKVDVDKIKDQLRMGIKVEKEHTKSAKVADEIARDHLGEVPNYYSKLNKAHLEESIDWDYVFGFILEEEGEPSFKVEKDDEGTERHTHIFTIPKITGKGKHRVEVNVDRFGKEHMAEFNVDGSTNIEDSKKIPGQIRMRILRGVAKALTSYARKNVKPGHSIYAGTYDDDYDNEKRKYGTQGRFFKGLARQLGGEYSDFGGVHSVNMPRRKKVAKAT